MTKINFGLGGQSANSPAAGAGRAPQQEWRQSQQSFAPAVDWTQPEYATPKPHPSWHSGKYMEPVVDVPELPMRNIRVRTVPPAMYYTLDGFPIPSDTFMTVPISPGIMAAIRSGDLERGEDPDDSPAPAPDHRPAPQLRRPRPQQPQQSASVPEKPTTPVSPAAE